MKKFLIVAVLALCFTRLASAEIIYLKDGSKLVGSIVSMEHNTVNFRIQVQTITVDKSTIDYIYFSPKRSELSASKIRGDQPELEYLKNFNLLIGDSLATNDLEGGTYFELDFLKKMSPNFSIGPGLGYSELPNKDETLSKGKLTTFPLILKLRFSSDPATTMFYLEGGVAEYFFHHTVDNSQFFGTYIINVKEEIENTFGGYIGGGVDVYRSPNVGIGFTVKRLIVKPHFKGTAKTYFGSFSTDDSVDLSRDIVALNLSCKF